MAATSTAGKGAARRPPKRAALVQSAGNWTFTGRDRNVRRARKFVLRPPAARKGSLVPYRDLRDYLATLEQHALLKRITREVDRSRDIACLAKWMYQALPVERRFGLMFQNVKGSSIPVVTAALGASPQSVALALQCEVEAINNTVVAALRHPIKPVIASTGICQEIELRGADARLDTLPVVTWTPGKDKAPYITTIVITSDHDSGCKTWGFIAPWCVTAAASSSICRPAGRARAMCRLDRSRQKGADCLGDRAPSRRCILRPSPICRPGQDEIEFAGGLKGEPIELVRSRPSTCNVPANSEIIVEAEITPGEHGK